MKVYKVTKNFHGKFISATVVGLALVEYKIGERSFPPTWLAEKGHGLFAFDSIENASDFIGSTPMTILECEHGEEVITPDASISMLQYGVIKLRDGELPWPRGTKTFTWLNPIRELPFRGV